jgi:hypothetical protein
MSTSLVPSNTSQLATLQHKFEELDAFAAQNSVTSLIGNGDVGAFTLTLRVSSAMQQLRDMITPEMMKPIMALQGSSLGFRTDKDKEGGYKEEVVKEVLIEATLKGFRMTQNETNIIGGRFYAARDGFERIFRDLGKQGRLTNLRLAPGIPKTTGDGAIVDYSGQGPDAVLGKAKRKMLAAIYSRITGTEITDGEVDDPRTLDVSVTPVKQEPKAKLSDEMIADLEKILKPHEDAANKYLLGIGWIATGETFRNISEKNARSILAKKDGFLSAAGIKG